MADRGSFHVESEALRQHAEVWATHSANAQEARDLITPALGKGDDFGLIAKESGVSAYYENWIAEMDVALGDAVKTFDYLHTALNAVADDYDGADSTVATGFDDLDRLNDLGR